MENGLGQEFRVARPSGVRGRWGGVVGVFVALQNLIRSDSCFTKDRFTSAHAEARAFLSTGFNSAW